MPTLLGSIAGLLERFGPGATVYPGHGGPTTLGRELDANPFLGPLRAT
jgi:hydroxyacylglutathione hydrolase